MSDQQQAQPASNNAEQKRGRPFEPGHPGGPGRPAGSRNKATLILDALADDEAEEILRSMIDKAKDGDMRAAEIILSRVWPQRKGRPVNLALPSIRTPEGVLEALEAVMASVSNGEITPDEAALVGSLIETKRKAIETVELEERLTRLEART